MITIELTAAIDTAGTLKTLYLSDDRFTTGPLDTPAHTSFLPRLDKPGSLGVEVFKGGRVGGGVSLEVGEIVVTNPDGDLDEWLDWGFDGQPVVIRSGEEGLAYPSTWGAVLTGTVDKIEAGFDQLVIRLRDRSIMFDLPALPNIYAGTNVGPVGLEGTAADQKGKRKPRLYGQASNFAPYVVNTSKLTYQVSDGPVKEITAVYDRGVALTPGADYATSALLTAATVTAATYATCLAEGLFRLGSSPAGLVTCDAAEGATAADRSAAQLLKRLALAAGVDGLDISSADVLALDFDNPVPTGRWFEGGDTFRAGMDELAKSVGAAYWFDPVGVFHMARLDEPTGLSAVDLQEYSMLDDLKRSPDIPIPVYQVKVNHTLNYSVQGSDLAGSVTDARRAFLAQARRSSTATADPVKLLHKLATTLEVDTLLVSSTDGDAEAARLLALHKVRRDIYTQFVPLEYWTQNGLGLMKEVRINLDRFGMDAGKLFIITGMRIELANDRVELRLWG